MAPLNNQIQFVDSPEFHTENADSLLEINVPELDRFFTVEEERILFRRMNYLKFTSQQALDPEIAANLLREAIAIRNRMVVVNLPFAKALVANWKHPNDEHSRDDQFSIAYLTLIRSVDLFDYQLDYAFLAYAGRAIRSRLSHFDRRLRSCREWLMMSDTEETSYFTNIPGPAEDLGLSDEIHCMTKVIEGLPEPDREFIGERFGLNNCERISVPDIAVRRGVSKSRIYQIEKRILNRLRNVMGAEV